MLICNIALQTVKGGISETRIEKRIVITGDTEIDHDKVEVDLVDLVGLVDVLVCARFHSAPPPTRLWLRPSRRPKSSIQICQ